MKEKEKWIIEAGMKLFARKGVLATSIQEIATESGISKGSFYLYFESKEALLLAIFRYYYAYIQKRVQDVELQVSDPKERFIEQMRVQLEEIAQHKEFIVMHAREHAIPFNQDIAEFVHNMREEGLTFLHNHLINIYGEERVQPYVADLTMLMQGMMHVLCEMILLHDEEVSLAEAASYMLQRTEHLLEGFERSGDKPIFKSYRTDMLCLSQATTQEDPKVALVNELRTILDEASHSAEGEYLRVTLEVLIEELSSGDPRQPIVEGMLYNLRNYQKLEKVAEMIRTHFCTAPSSRA